MNVIERSEVLGRDIGPMERLQQKFIALLSQAQAADDTTLPARWNALFEHAQKQFRREGEWMRKARHAQLEQHALQHRAVLHVMQEGLVKARSGKLPVVRDMVNELVAWYSKHRQTLDAALALQLQRIPPRPQRSRPTISKERP